MKKRRINYQLIVVLTGLILIVALTACAKETGPASSAPPSMVTDDKAFSVAAGKTYTLYVRAEAKDPIEASFTVMGGEDDIDIMVKDAMGNIAVEKRRATDSGAFAFFSTGTGYHQVIFDNTFSTQANKLIFLKITHPSRGGIVP